MKLRFIRIHGNLNMGTFSFKGQVSILVCCALMLMLMSSAAERQVFLQPVLSTWDEARSHCQKCFKDLVTVTPENNHIIAQNLSGEHWVGLRKSFDSSLFNNTTGNSSSIWSRWANGDPLAFQNWYPGWPVFKSPFPRRDCCSCSCTCPNVEPISTTRYTDFTTQNMTDESLLELINNSTQYTTTPTTTAMPPVESTCVRTPVVVPDVPDPDENYIEDSCVAMLSFGAWIERNCSELLPFICYDDRFFGEVKVTNITMDSADLMWKPGPVGTTHYRVDVNGYKTVTATPTDLTYEVKMLTPGTRYSVQVFPVKCNRDLDPQVAHFYTTPQKVINLQATSRTETSISLSWNKSAGNVESYLIEVQGRQNFSFTTEMESKQVSKLVPGNLYTFTVFSVVNNSIKSEASSISEYTKPGKVSNLIVLNNTNQSLELMWELLEGNASCFRVTALDNSNSKLFEDKVDEMEVTVSGLPSGTKITLFVTALVNNTLEGDNATTFGYTAPGPISDLNLTSATESIHAMWRPPEGSYSSFVIQVLEGNQTVVTLKNVTEAKKNITNLNNAACYKVIVYGVSGHLKGPEVCKEKCTLPLPVTNLSASHFNHTSITITWTPPSKSSNINYSVKVNSGFWGYSCSKDVNGTTSYTFTGLKSGTKYYFQVQTKSDGKISPAICVSQRTAVEKRVVSLSMLCTSTKLLLCENSTTHDSIYTQLEEHFRTLLKDDISWNLTKITDS